MKNNYFKYYITAVFICSTIVMFAQPADGSTGDPLEGVDPAAPIDDYIWVLVLVGLLCAFMKFRALVQQKSFQKK